MTKLSIQIKCFILAVVALVANLAAIWVFDQAIAGLLIQITGLMVVITICLIDFFKREIKGDVLLIAGFVLMAAFLVYLAQVCITLTFDDYYTRFSVGQITDVVLYLFVFLLTSRIVLTFDCSSRAKLSWLIYAAFLIAIAFPIFLSVQGLIGVDASPIFYLLLITMSLAAFGAVRLLTYIKNIKQAMLPVLLLGMILLQFFTMSLLATDAIALDYTVECARSFLIIMVYPICCLNTQEHLG